LGKSWVKDFRVIIAGRGAGGRRNAERRVASVGGIVIVVCTLVVSIVNVQQ
jgi:hypothetical protein